jgi:hypothetical protein
LDNILCILWLLGNRDEMITYLVRQIDIL